MRSIQLPILATLLALVGLVYCQYLNAAPSAFNVSLPGSNLLLNFADNDLTVSSHFLF